MRTVSSVLNTLTENSSRQEARTHERHLAEVLAHVRDPGQPAAFD